MWARPVEDYECHPRDKAMVAIVDRHRTWTGKCVIAKKRLMAIDIQRCL